MLIYSGWGLLGMVVYFGVFAGYFFTLLFFGFWKTEGDFATNNLLQIAAGCLAASLAVFAFGKFINRNPAYNEILTKDGKQHKAFAPHTLYHLPVEFSGFVITAAAIIVYFIRKFL